jgi:hypothetical protein
MKNLAYRIPVIESEKGWGRKIDDYMVCLTSEDCLEYKKDFNSENTDDVTPDWYMVVEGEPEEIYLSDEQYEILESESDSRHWYKPLMII